jgi:uncharacterized MAPEG superfamily protein
MTSLFTALGLRPSSLLTPAPTYTGYYIIFNFVFAYAGLSARALKFHYRLDHNVAPRQDIATYGEAALKAGKINQQQLNMLKRNQAAHENAVENFPLFVGALLYAHHCGLPTTTINASALVYSFVRLVYGAVYVWGKSPTVSWMRTVCWWTGNITCLRLFWIGTKLLNNKA